ncbi:MAG: FG-GAP-like repeat-containing protein, partial [Polyangia bacterium]
DGDGGAADLSGSTDIASGPPVAARLVYPLSTSTVTNHRPHVRWQLAAAATNPQLEFCTTRACDQLIGSTTIDAGGLSGSPTADLPVGTVFWRVRTTGPGGESNSATWEFTVQKRFKPIESIDTSWGTFLDVNGDGRGDVAVGAPLAPVKGVTGVGRVYIFNSNVTGFETTPVVIDGGGGMTSELGVLVFSAGDVNGDGFADLAVVNAAGDTFIYHSGPNGIVAGATPNTVVPAAVPGASIAAAGDVNGDGYADLVVGAPQNSMPGQAYTLLGGPSGISKVPVSIVDGSDAMTGATSPQFGTSVSGAGDINGDGFDDVVIGAPDQGTGKAYVYLGGPTKLSPFPQSPLGDPSLTGFGKIVKGANDLDGDGYADLIVGGNGSQTVDVVLGGVSSFRTGPKLTDAQSGSGFASDPRNIGAVGDVNGDGLADVVIGAAGAFPGTGGVPGAIHLFLASVSGSTLSMNDTGAIYGPDGDNGAFSVAAGAGDVNGDGRADVLVGAPCAPANGGSCGDGTAYLFKGQPGGFVSSADQKWVGPDSHGSFGIVATLQWRFMRAFRPHRG